MPKKKYPSKVTGNTIYLKILSIDDVGEKYVGWMGDTAVTQFLESRWEKHTPEDIKEYVRTMEAGESNFLFGIFLKKNDEHIGNIKIGNINELHKFADVGLLIGDRSNWGKNYATEAIGLITKYAFEILHLNSLTAGMYAGNAGSYKAFIKAGFREAGRFMRRRLYNGVYSDEILVEKCKDA